MSNLSGYDSEAVGFDSVPPIRKQSVAISTQTTEFEEREIETQTNVKKDVGCTASTEQFTAAEYPAGLNEFLRKVVPGVLEQLDLNDREMALSSDSEDGEVMRAVLLHEIKVRSTLGSGDHQNSILSLSWSSSSNLAVSTGSKHHETWCQGPGLVQICSLKGSNKKQVQDLEERECVTVLCYHPTVVALLAYGTASGELVVRQGCSEPLNITGDPARVTCLRWAETTLANVYLTMLVRSRGTRRCASDQVLFSSGSDGAVNVWRVNWDLKTFENIVRYTLDAVLRPRPDITSFDIPKSHPLTAFEERAPEVFVVGTKSGDMFVCAISDQLDVSDPVRERLEGHKTCVLEVAFSRQKSGVFISISTDSELRMYRLGQAGPLRTFCLDVPVSCMSWLGSGPCVVVGLAEVGKEALRMYNATTGKVIPVEGLFGSGGVTCVDVCHSGCYRIAAGDASNTVRIWELPAFRDKFIWDACVN